MKANWKGMAAVVAAAAALLAPGAVRAADPIIMAGVLELSGPGAGVGANWRDSLTMAAKEINAKGGILGRPIELRFYDTQTNPGQARGQLQKALDEEPYVIFGPTYSGSVKVAMMLAQQAEVPQFIGATAPELTEMGNPYLFRMYFSQKLSIPKIADYMRDVLKTKTAVLIWANDDFGKGGRDTFLKEAAARGIKVVADISAENGQADFAADVVKAKGSGADAVFLYLHEEENARFVREAVKQGYDKPMLGDATAMNPKVAELAGSAANGLMGFIGLSADAPVPALQDYAARFKAAYNYLPDHNGFQGYMALYAIKAMTERVGKVDSKALADAMRGGTITVEQEPNILLSTTWNEHGDIDREAFLARIEDGKQKIIQTLPKSGK